jgi:chemotaxis protein CheD
MSQRVGIAELRVARAPVTLKAPGIGSCLVIALYDPVAKLGGLVHSLLPKARTREPLEQPARYVDTAIPLLVEALAQAGAEVTRLRASIAGGANTFEADDVTLIDNIGARNVRSARETLAALNLPLRGEEVGGNRNRSVEFHLASGQLLVYSARGPRAIML